MYMEFRNDIPVVGPYQGIASLPEAAPALRAPQTLSFTRVGNTGLGISLPEYVKTQEDLDNYIFQMSAPEMPWRWPTTLEGIKKANDAWMLDLNNLGEFQSKYNTLTPVPGYENVYQATLQQPGKHKYDTMEAFYRVDPETGQATLVGDPIASRQSSSVKNFVKQDLPVLLAMLAPQAVPWLAGAGFAGSNAAAGAAYGAGSAALTGGNTQDILKAGALGGIAGGIKDYFGSTTPRATDSLSGGTSYTSAGAGVGSDMGFGGGWNSGVSAGDVIKTIGVPADIANADLSPRPGISSAPDLQPIDSNLGLGSLPISANISPGLETGEVVEITGKRLPPSNSISSGDVIKTIGIPAAIAITSANLSPIENPPDLKPINEKYEYPELPEIGDGPKNNSIIPDWLRNVAPGIVGLIDKVPASVWKGLLPAIAGYAAYKDAKKPQLTGFGGSIQPRTATQTIEQSRYGPIVRTSFAQGGIAGIPRYIGGTHDGMQDTIPARIDGEQPAALSGGEFVIPADVVSHIGNGNSQAGAKQLFDMMARIRQARTGTTKQSRQINPMQFMPK
jgi:hypothetical protein